MAYRFLVLNYVDAMEASPKLVAMARAREQTRREMFEAALSRHAKAGSLDGRRLASRLERIREASTLVMRHWIVSARFSDVERTEEQSILHYAKVWIGLLEPVCTERGEAELRRILRGARDREALAPLASVASPGVSSAS